MCESPYLLRTFAAGDGDRSLSTPLTRYYAEKGSPPGWWIGQGLAGIETRVAALDATLSPAARADQVAQIEAEETERGTRRAVAGFDYTFSVPKSASVLWAVADAGTQSLIAQAHHAAIAEIVAFIEREVATTRVVATGPDGAAAPTGCSPSFSSWLV